MKLNVDPRYIPPNPPGYVWVTNSWENFDKAFAYTMRVAGCTEEEVLVLDNIIPKIPHSYFVPECYSSRVDAQKTYLSEMLEILRLQAENQFDWRFDV